MSVEITLRPESRGALSVYPIESFRDVGVDAFFTDRFGGVSSGPYDSLNLGNHVNDDEANVTENRRRVAEAINVERDRLRIIRQVHGSTVIDASKATSATEADALVSDRDDLALAILVADCVPIALADTSTSAFALVHAGWRGLHVGVIAAAIKRFDDPARVTACIGPSISIEGYQVGSEVAQHFSSVPNALLPDGDEKFRLDLRRVTEQQLLNAGIPETSIERTREVTDGGEVFFSDRAQRPCGRFALVAKRAS